MDVLRALPGVTETNYHQLAAKVLCLQDLFVMSLAAMQAILGAENGRKLHTFINTQVVSPSLGFSFWDTWASLSPCRPPQPCDGRITALFAQCFPGLFNFRRVICRRARLLSIPIARDRGRRSHRRGSTRAAAMAVCPIPGADAKFPASYAESG
jgi:hypothetical protein